MKSNNIFSGGQVSDISKLLQAKNVYLEAVNFRNITELGQSTGSLVTVKGNKCEVALPTLQKVFKFRLNSDGTGTSQFTIKVNAYTSSTINVNASTTTEDVYNILKDMPNCYETTNTGLVVPKTFAVAYNSEEIFIYQNPEYSTCSISESTVGVIVNTVALVGNNYFVFYNSSGAEVNNPPIPPYFIDVATNDITVIGSTFIHETIYLFTCPTSNPNSIGQIWEMSYNETSQTTTIKLLYNNYINFSTTYPIAPSAATGRYELEDVQRIYWTDFNNPVRTCNVKDPNLFALSPDLMSLKSNVKFNVPVLSNITDTGAIVNLSSGSVYQCAYRLSKNNGGVTNYSNPSNMVYLTEYEMQRQANQVTHFSAMTSSNGLADSTKTLQWTVGNVDINYDKIEFVIIVRNNVTGNYTIHKYDEQLINGQDTITTVFKNDTANMDEITINEFLLDTVFFSHCKTLEQKDNRLFFGNVRNEVISELENFDTRVYRFGTGLNANNIDVKKYESDINGNVTTYSIPTGAANEWAAIPDNADNIPVINLGFDTADHPDYDGTFKYLRGGTEIGAEGPNIKVRFGSLLLRSDKEHFQPNVGAPNFNTGTERDFGSGGTQQFSSGYRIASYPYSGGGININPTDLGTTYQLFQSGGTKASMGGEYYSGLLKSYQQNEIYRYGIVFYDKAGQESFVKWVGDIKMPDYSDTNSHSGSTAENTTVPDFRSMTVTGGGGAAYCNVPYVQFEVTIPPSLAEYVGAYEIVRVKREQDDRTVAGHGLITQCAYGIMGAANDSCLPIPYQSYDGGTNILDPPTFPAGTGFPCEAPNSVAAFHCFDFLVNGATQYATSGDKLYIKERYQYLVNGACNPTGAFPGSENMYYVQKYYQHIEHFNGRHNMTDFQYCGLGGVTNTLNGTGGMVYRNYSMDTSSGVPVSYSDARSNSIGSPVHIAAVSDTITWENYNAYGTNSKLLGIIVRPSKLSTQYGGRTYIKRASNEYITTGCFQTVESSGTSIVKVYGGDIYHGILDVQKAIKNWGHTGRAGAFDSNKCSQTWFFPTHGVLNVDLRHGTHINADLNVDTSAIATCDYGYYNSFSYENELIKYYPKPIFFNETDRWDNRIYWSEVKINGESSDSWTNILTNSYYDLEGSYGPINALTILGNNMYALQDRAFASLLINPVSMTTDNNSQDILLGRGDVLSKHNYISIDAGTKHQWSVARSQSAITFVDIRSKRVYLFNGSSLEPISDTKSNRNYFIKRLNYSILSNDNPILRKGILTTYDFYHNEFLYTTLDTHTELSGEGGDIEVNDRNTIAYSTLTGNFVGMYSFTPYIYVNNNSKLYSFNETADTKAWLHNIGNYGQFYGTTYKSYLKVLINDNPIHTKVFDNLMWHSESIDDNLIRLDDYSLGLPTTNSDNVNYTNDTFQRVRCYNEYQNTDWVTLSLTNPISNLRRSEQGWNMYVSRNKVNYDTTPINTKSIFDPTVLTKTSFGERMRDKYLIVDLEYDNALNNRFIVNNLASEYRTSDR